MNRVSHLYDLELTGGVLRVVVDQPADQARPSEARLPIRPAGWAWTPSPR